MTRKQALAILNPETNTGTALKQAYRAACKKHHPDQGGTEDTMKLVNLAYETLNKCDWTEADRAQAAKQTPLTETMKEKLQAVSFPGITAELIGTWLWLSGETYKYRKEIKAAGFKFSRNKKSWHFHENTGYRKFSKKNFSMDDIRDSFGTEGLDTNPAQGLAA